MRGLVVFLTRLSYQSRIRVWVGFRLWLRFDGVQIRVTSSVSDINLYNAMEMSCLVYIP